MDNSLAYWEDVLAAAQAVNDKLRGTVKMDTKVYRQMEEVLMAVEKLCKSLKPD